MKLACDISDLLPESVFDVYVNIFQVLSELKSAVFKIGEDLFESLLDFGRVLGGYNFLSAKHTDVSDTAFDVFTKEPVIKRD